MPKHLPHVTLRLCAIDTRNLTVVSGRFEPMTVVRQSGSFLESGRNCQPPPTVLALTDVGLPGGMSGRQVARFRAHVWSFRDGDGTMTTTSNEKETVMEMRILWPNLPTQLVPVAIEAVGLGFETEFREKFEDVTDEQWANADAVVGGSPRNTSISCTIAASS
jgi:hypothetical protein